MQFLAHDDSRKISAFQITHAIGGTAVSSVLF